MCPDCGQRNAPGTEFCVACGSYLAWDGGGGPAPGGVPSPGSAAAPPSNLGPGQRPRATGSSPPPAQHQRPSATAQPQVRTSPPGGGAPGYSPGHGAQYGTAGQGAQGYGGPPTGGYRPTGPDAPGWFPPGPVGFHPNQPQGWPAPGPHGGPPPGGAAGQYAGGSAAPEAPVVPTERPCPRCGVVNPAERRFCAKCGLALRGPALDGSAGFGPPPEPERASWWHRWFRPAPNTRRAARRAYRSSLPVQIRLLRWLWVVLGVLVLGGGLYLLGQDPIRWIGDRWADLRHEVVQVSDVQAVAAPAESAIAQFAAGNLVDNRANTAWATAWSANSAADPTVRECQPPASPVPAGAPGTVILLTPDPIAVREIEVAAGLPADDPRRQREWRPRTLQLAFSDGQCRQVELSDVPELQKIAVEPVESSQIRVSVIDAYPPVPDQPVDQVSISELRLYTRP